MEMEAAVESVSELPSSNNIKLNEVSEKPPPIQEETSRKSNGVAELTNVMPLLAEADNDELHSVKTDASTELCMPSSEAVSENAPDMSCNSEGPVLSNCNEVISEEVYPVCEAGEQEQNDSKIAEGIESIVEETKVSDVNAIHMEEVVVESEKIDTESSENVRFETEILVEANDVNEVEIDDSKTYDPTNNILNELGQNIELSEVLRSSDVTENVDNNNCAVRQEVFNKEELLDILEGNDVQSATGPYGAEILSSKKDTTLEAQMAMEQLSRLKQNSRRGKHSDSVLKKKTVHKPTKSTVKANKGKNAAKANKEENLDRANKDENTAKSNEVENTVKSNKEVSIAKTKKEESIVKALVRDWDDEDLPEDDSSKTHELAEPNLNDTENVALKKEETTEIDRASIDSTTSDGQTPAQNKATDDGQPQRRLGRVIKKKVIFDPDNPDTFTKSKMHKSKETQSDKEAHPLKKVKLEQSGQRAKSKSPVSKMQWKKPPPKNNKQIKRLSEVDKLLMDEGAVNMIYQLTPEAPKGKKNMKTKAEFIKKLQSSTPEGKEMKFRERKKECIKEEGEAKKILGKQRSSLSSSVKSPSACDDFETHSADDSIIYRRHSSSSYSSTCMSPRRLSDVDGSVGAGNTSQLSKDQANLSCPDADSVMDTVPQESPISNEMINKDDCLSIKKKLNSKLSLALNKRKRESSKTDKPIKKKFIKTDVGDHKEEDVEVDVFKHLSITFHKGVAEISIRKTGSKYNADIFYELEEALACVDRRSDISLTLMTSDCGTLCSDFDLTPLHDFNAESRTKTAQYIAESVRAVLSAVSRHSKVVCAGVWGACRGVGLALLALSDVALASEAASFALSAHHAASLTPGLVAVLGALPLPQALVNDLVIFERQLSATEALQSGLISRVLWPTGVTEQLQTIVTDIANQPVQTLLLKKKLLKLRTSADNTFLAQLEAERALFVEYWSSEEGLEALVRGNPDPLSSV